MFGIINFTAFLFAGILLNLTPGADTLYILGRSVANGKNAGILSALGISTGSLLHTMLAALGLSVLLSESQIAFNMVKFIGAAYLFYLGIRAFFTSNKNDSTIEKNNTPQKHSQIYLSGILTNLLNPKVALFYLAFLPQFIDPNYTNPFISFILLGLIFTTTGTIWCLALAIYAANFSKKIRANNKVKIWLDRITGLVFISLGIKLALNEK